MKFEEKRTILKNEMECVLCPTTPEYAKDMIEYLKITAGETPYLLRNPDEVTFSLEEEKEILSRILEDERCIMMLALVDGKVAGNGAINGLGTRRRIKHRCSLAIALKKKYWGIGIGTAMMEYLIQLAIHMGYEQIELELVDGNISARRLYEKYGFIETGRRIKALKYDDGTYADEIIMWRSL